jgi:hypothetical protein
VKVTDSAGTPTSETHNYIIEVESGVSVRRQVIGVPSAAVVSSSQTRNSTSYGNLSTSGPAVTVGIFSSRMALMTLTGMLSSPESSLTQCYMGFAVSGATSVSASDTQSLNAAVLQDQENQVSATYLVTGLNPGSNTFTAKYRSDGNDCTFSNRNIIVTPY